MHHLWKTNVWEEQIRLYFLNGIFCSLIACSGRAHVTDVSVSSTGWGVSICSPVHRGCACCGEEQKRLATQRHSLGVSQGEQRLTHKDSQDSPAPYARGIPITTEKPCHPLEWLMLCASALGGWQASEHNGRNSPSGHTQRCWSRSISRSHVMKPIYWISLT